ncbi:hypothetical protein KR51_00003340 [Rubidibacter lacunae KORDI 51-2]|uniref:Uncharacterized protein n=1 Tax=Rubidibacter lacunae KORDI 51-2 TaxID=582515 RepID=U5DQX4_9CHRO|nr:hypothetical protein KR51_00003340 [Rubidibacter lacunae KORDI 51-2]
MRDKRILESCSDIHNKRGSIWVCCERKAEFWLSENLILSRSEISMFLPCKRVGVADTSTLILTDFATANCLYGFEDAAARAPTQQPNTTAKIERSHLGLADRSSPI